MTWEDRLRRARRIGKFHAVDKRLVGEWPTCAIGEKYHVTKRNLIGSGVTSAAESLGMQFLYAVKEDNIYRAVEIYDQIQRQPV